MGHGTLNVIDPSEEVYVRSKGLNEGTDYLDNHEVPTLTPGHIKIDNLLDHPPDTSKGRHHFVTLITDSRPTSYSHHTNHE